MTDRKRERLFGKFDAAAFEVGIDTGQLHFVADSPPFGRDFGKRSFGSVEFCGGNAHRLIFGFMNLHHGRFQRSIFHLERLWCACEQESVIGIRFPYIAFSRGHLCACRHKHTHG